MALIKFNFDEFINLKNRMKLQLFYSETTGKFNFYMFLESQIFNTDMTLDEIRERFGISDHTLELFKATYLHDAIKIEALQEIEGTIKESVGIDTKELKTVLDNFLGEFSKLTTTTSGGSGTAGQALIPVHMGSGKITRCMSCGQIVLSGETRCPACGSENLTGKDVEMDMNKWIGFDFMKDMDYIIEFLETYELSQITDVSKKQKNKIKEALIDSLKEGVSLNQLEEKINKVVDDENKARMIARTETIRAANEGAILHYKDLDIEKVKWIAVPSAPGGRTCKTCLERNGKEFLLKDAQGQIPLHPFCRCVFSPVV